ncbi:P-type ATPase [Cavenderia fasciculata]|uniref:Plasma membrane ATPase n=1 Tax=Cavenderia fasciculata TaxID=261658 RepID=F4PNV2_CACFS|nr:P-type ATPase [Cavenderia fasciculata]EGG23155.1 P-type ATPase [Cavenderia fasciculata]|eukprot:XP_004361006.1 P-type ATPase [Cavenderia fasciculata]
MEADGTAFKPPMRKSNNIYFLFFESVLVNMDSQNPISNNEDGRTEQNIEMLDLNTNNNNNNNHQHQHLDTIPENGQPHPPRVSRTGSLQELPFISNDVADSTKTFSGFPSSKTTEGDPSSSQEDPRSVTTGGSYDYRKSWRTPLRQQLFNAPTAEDQARVAKEKQENFRKTLERKADYKPIENILSELQASDKGLTTAEVEERKKQYGENKIPDVKRYPILEFLSFMWNPLSWTMEIAALVSIILLDWVDFILICALLFLNASIGYYEEHTAGNAVEALKNSLISQARVLRDGEWKAVASTDLVPGDITMIKIGAIIPADLRVIKCESVKIDQSSLTGESLPVSKKEGDEIFSGSAMKQGEATCIVTATGVKTFFGRSASLLQETGNTGHLQIVLRNIGFFCITFIVIWVFIEIMVQFVGRKAYCVGVGEGNCTTLNNALVLLVGGIPIAMPTVLSVTMAIGATQLSKKEAIVSRLTAIEELAAMDILCSDKTGTLTLNILTVDVPICFDGSTPENVMFDAYLACSEGDDRDAIDIATSKYCETTYPGLPYSAYKIVKHYPFNPEDKKAMGLVQCPDGKQVMTAKGAPQIILNSSCNKDRVGKEVERQIEDLADHGYRAIGVARAEDYPDFKEWKFTGLIPLFDPPRHDTEETIKRALDMGVRVKMITGDQLAIAKETARRLGMGGNFFTIPYLKKNDLGMKGNELIEMADGFAEMWPEHKYKVVKSLQKRKHVVGMTGDGVNDAPALKKANIGIAVAGATDAARSVSDIVLTSAGLSVIIDSIITSRKIFQRMRNYVIYSVSATVRICVTFGILTVAWNFLFPTIATVIIAILNDGTMLTIAKDRVIPRNEPDSWNLFEVFVMAIAYGLYLVASTIVFFSILHDGTWFERTFDLRHLNDNELRGLIYLQVSISGLATIFVSRSQGFSYFERPGLLMSMAFVLSQIIATFIGVYGLRGYPHNGETDLQGCGWGYALVAWIWCLLWYIPMDFIKFGITYILRGHLPPLINLPSNIKKREEKEARAREVARKEEDILKAKQHAAAAQKQKEEKERLESIQEEEETKVVEVDSPSAINVPSIKTTQVN